MHVLRSVRNIQQRWEVNVMNNFISMIQGILEVSHNEVCSAPTSSRGTAAVSTSISGVSLKTRQDLRCQTLLE